MKLLTLLIFWPLAFAWPSGFQCQDSDNGHNVSKAGKVVYSLGEELCLQADCYNQLVKEHDRCKSKDEILEFSCGQGQVIEKIEKCPHQCAKGRCL